MIIDKLQQIEKLEKPNKKSIEVPHATTNMKEQEIKQSQNSSYQSQNLNNYQPVPWLDALTKKHWYKYIE